MTDQMSFLDAESGLVHTMVATSANVRDVTQAQLVAK